jgi:hypothetical protein
MNRPDLGQDEAIRCDRIRDGRIVAQAMILDLSGVVLKRRPASIATPSNSNAKDTREPQSL